MTYRAHINIPNGISSFAVNLLLEHYCLTIAQNCSGVGNLCTLVQSFQVHMMNKFKSEDLKMLILHFYELCILEEWIIVHE